MSAPAAISWRNSPRFVRASERPARLDRQRAELQEAKRLRGQWRTASRKPIFVAANGQDAGRLRAQLLQERQAHLDAAEANVARLEREIDQGEKEHAEAMVRAAEKPLRAEADALSARIQLAMPKAIRLVKELAGVQGELFDLCDALERDFPVGDPVVRAVGAGLSCPAPVRLPGVNCGAFLAAAKAAGWTIDE